MRKSIAFYEALGFARKFRATGEAVAFFDTGGTVIGLFPWDQLADDASLPDQPRPQAFRGMTLAWNCNSTEEVDAVMEFAISKGAKLVRPAERPTMAVIGAISPIPTAIPGRPWLPPISRSERIGACICRIRQAKYRLLLRAVKAVWRAEVPGCVARACFSTIPA